MFVMALPRVRRGPLRNSGADVVQSQHRLRSTACLSRSVDSLALSFPHVFASAGCCLYFSRVVLRTLRIAGFVLEFKRVGNHDATSGIQA